MFSVSVNGGTPAQLTFGAYVEGAAALSPAADWLACLRVPAGYVVSGAGSCPYALVAKPSWSDSPWAAAYPRPPAFSASTKGNRA